MEIKHLTAENYDEMLNLLNYTFGTKYGRVMDFTAEQPKMWVRDDEYMGKHIGVFEDDKLVSVIGIYPLPVQILGKKFLFATTGNLATLPEYEGRGYFRKLFDETMKILDEMGADVARLGGARQRYERYGYSQCSMLYYFVFSEYNRTRCFKDFKNDVEIRPLERNNTSDLKFCMDLCNSKDFFVERFDTADYRDVYTVLCSKEATPYIAYRDGKPIGYLSVYKNKTKILEIRANSTEEFFDVLCAYQMYVGEQIDVPIAPYMQKELEIMGRCGNEISIASPSKFKIINFEGITDAFMKLKRKNQSMPNGEFVMDIEGYGKIRIYSDDTTSGCEKTEKAADICVNKDAATRIIFGFPFEFTNTLPDCVKIWFPLPLSWDFEDYV